MTFRMLPKPMYMKLSGMGVILSHQLFIKHKNALQCQVNYDEFETSNPLNSKCSVHERGVIYFVF